METEKNLIRASLASVRAELMEAVSRLSDDLLSWAPAPGMRTCQGQLVEILSTEHDLLSRLRGESVDFRATEDRYRAMSTLTELTDALHALRAETLSMLDSATEEWANADAGVSASFAEWLQLPTVPRIEIFRLIARHESYHAGQIVSYLWARGDDPYSWD
jgi:uncharacterized damage-inducible protein DinB